MTTVIVTGASRGIGCELVRQYAADGAQVFACCRNPRAATSLQDMAASSDGRIRIRKLDVTNPRDLQNLRKEIGKTPIDILINNAGISDGREAGIDYDVWEEAFRVNSIAPYRASMAFHKNIAASTEKKLVTISSMLGSIADNTGGRTAYRSSKAAVNQVMKGLACDLKAHGIVVVILHPGWVRTDMGGSQAPVLPEDSVRGIRRVIANATIENTGRFIDYQGRELPW